MPAQEMADDMHSVAERRLRRIDQRYTSGRRAIIELLVSAGVLTRPTPTSPAPPETLQPITLDYNITRTADTAFQRADRVADAVLDGLDAVLPQLLRVRGSWHPLLHFTRFQ